MPIKYSLVENALNPEANCCRAIVQKAPVLDEAALVERMVARGSTLTRGEVLATLEVLKQTCLDALRDGCRVNTDLFRMFPTIRGKFEGSDDRFDPSRHSVAVKMAPGPLLRGVGDRVSVRKIRAHVTAPVLDLCKDATSGETNARLTAGGAASVQGAYLKIRPRVEGSGVFFIDERRNETAVTRWIRNQPRELIFMIPALSPGIYRIEVRTAPHDRAILRRAVLDAPLTVLE